MLVDLDIRGLLLIDKVKVEFGRGLHVVTGETGAGKSILIRALHLLLGAKASGDTVAKHHKQMSVCGRFRLPPEHEGLYFVNSLGIEQHEGPDNLIVRRSINPKGRSQCWINDTAVTLASLRKLGGMLIDIFAQHDNQQLLNDANHSTELDAFLKDKNIKERYQAAYRSASSAHSRLKEKLESHSDKLSALDYLEFRKEQFSKLAPSLKEYSDLLYFCKNAENRLDERQHLIQAAQYIDRGFEGKSLSQGLWTSLNSLSKIESPNDVYKRLKSNLQNLAESLDDFGFDIAQCLAKSDSDLPQLEAAQARIAEYQQFMRRTGCSEIDQVINEQKKNLNDLEEIKRAGHIFTEELAKLSSRCNEVSQLALLLSGRRHEAASQIQELAKKEFAELAMKHANLSTEFAPIEKSATKHLDLSILGESFVADHKTTTDFIEAILSRHKEDGGEKIRFLLSTNPGQPLKPLSNVASGGEISRIMLALKRVLLAGASSCVLVFDEIDTGISGRIADMVGKKLREMSEKAQVICISHLAQVASYAHHHLQVEKISSNSQDTQVQLRTLRDDERAFEVAKLLSGEVVTELSLANAKSLLKRRPVTSCQFDRS